jgi:hypothetical protein
MKPAKKNISKALSLSRSEPKKKATGMHSEILPKILLNHTTSSFIKLQ